MSLTNLSRRQFMNRSLAAAGVGAGFAIGGTKSSGRVIGANDTVRVAIAGLNGRGGRHVGAVRQDAGRRDHLSGRSRHPDLQEASRRRSPRRAARLRRPSRTSAAPWTTRTSTPSRSPRPTTGIALITIWACQAGKDVYVEKPCSHNVHEGRIAVEAARQYNRIVQHGTQSRSSHDWALAAAAIQSGKLGKLLVSRALCYKPRGSIGVKPDDRRRPSRSISTSGSAPRPSSRITPTSSITTGTGSGTSATATSATRASTRWTSPAG